MLKEFIVLKNYYNSDIAIDTSYILSVRKHTTSLNRLGIVIRYTNDSKETYISCKDKRHQSLTFQKLVGK